jgi:membrane protease YdiL (CAAX protease family)
MAAHTISRTTIVAVLVATIAALIARSWLQIQLTQGGMQSLLAADLSYLVVPPILIVFLFPLWKTEKQFLGDQFRIRDLTWRLVVQAFAIGLLIRMLWWSQVIAGGSFGFYASSDPNAIVGPVFSFQCESPEIVFLGFVVMAILVPLIEEITHRGFVQTALNRRGFVLAILISSAVFTAFHRFGSWPTVFMTGLILGSQYWITRSLWSSIVTHATVNGLIQIDWRCLSGQWNPKPDELPLLVPGVTAAFVFVVCLLMLFFLLHNMATGTKTSSR